MSSTRSGSDRGGNGAAGANRAQRRKARRRSRTLVGASLVAFSGLASGYLQMLRTPAAYASTTCTASSESTLAACLSGLSSASGAVTISLTTDITLTADLPSADLTTTSVDLTIQGNGNTVNGAGNQVFLVDTSADDTLLITDVTITDTDWMYASAVYVKGGSPSATLDRLTVRGATSSSGFGGAVYSALSEMTVIDSTFEDCHSAGSGGDGGAIYATDDLHIQGSTFINNSAANDHGGAVYSGYDVYVAGSTFIGNDANEMGGAIYAAHSAYVYDSYFADNSAGTYGGAVVAYDEDLIVADSEFIRNAAVGKGGALYNEAPNLISIARSTFADNSAGYGGALYARSGGSTEVIDSTFTGNEATDSSGRGGALYVPEDLVVSGSTFTENSAANGGAVAAYGGSPTSVSVANSTFNSNVATAANGSGGAIYAYAYNRAVSVELSFSTFVGNVTANTDDSGSTIWGSSGTQSVTMTTVATVIDDTGTVPCWLTAPGAGATLTLDDTFAFAAGANATAGESCSFDGSGSDDTFVAGDFQLGSLQDNGGLTDTFLPGLTSPLVLRAPSASDLVDDTVAFDQRAATRPSGSPSLFTIGSVQSPGDPAPGGSNAPVASAGNASAEVASPTTTEGGSPTSWVIRAFTVDDTYLIRTDDTCAIGSGSGTCTVTGLTNGQPYKFKATPSNAQGPGRASLASNTVTPTAPTPPNPNPTYPPSAPRDPVAVAGDRQANVSWQIPSSSGSFPISQYQVTSSPAGGSCLTASLSCTISGLTNGVEYTFAVRALNGAGWGASATSNPVTPGGTTPAPPVQPLPGPLTPGESLLQVNGQPDPDVTVDPNTKDNGLVISGDGWSMDLDGLGPDGKPLNLTPEGVLRLQNERDVATEGRGFLPNSDVDLYVDPPVLLTGASAVRGRADSEGLYVGTVRTDSSGNFTGTATLPEGITPGEHVLQAVGYSPTVQSRAMSLGVLVERSLVLNQGTRKPAGRHDRIVTGGSSTGIPVGVKLTPHIRYGTGEWKDGVATITVQSDGSFTWKRLIRKDKKLTAYVSYEDTNSNEVIWLKVR